MSHELYVKWILKWLSCLFCFKQKTAYEMRISDWSSDVCSSDLDQVVASIDDLVNALNSTTPGGKDVGHLLSVAARTMDGNGARTRDAMVAGEKALRTINNNGDDLTRVTSNLATLTEAIKARDKTIRAFSSDVSTTSTVVATQRKSITSPIRDLDSLTSTGR